MQHFIKRLFFFLLPLMIVAIPLDILITKTLKKTHEYEGEIEVWNKLYEGKINADVLIYGSSRAWTHINPTILEDSLHKNVYNLGMDGQIFDIQYLRHIEYLQYNRKPATIILSLDIFSLEKSDELFNKNQFLPYMLRNDTIEKYTAPYKGFTWIDFHAPLVRYFFNPKATIHTLTSAIKPNSTNYYRNKGYRAKDEPWDGKFEAAQKSSIKYNAYADSGAIKLLEHFIAECLSKNIQLIFVYSPEYIEGQQYIANREKVIAVYNTIANNNQLLFLDYSNDTICQNKQLFYNSTHLNKQGSEIFSKQLAKDLKQAVPVLKP